MTDNARNWQHRVNHLVRTVARRARLNFCAIRAVVIGSAIVKSSGFCEIGPMPACFSEQGGSHRRGGASAPQKTEISKCLSRYWS